MPSVLFSTIQAILEQKSMLKHPFYQAWNDGKLTRDSLKEYACQYYHFVKDFPRMVSAVHSNAPDFSVRQELLQNLIDEEQGPENHPALWMRFANALGASDEDVLRTRPLPTTSALVATMMDSCRNGSFQEGAATLYAYESQIPEVSRVKREGLNRFYGITDSAATKFFSVHEQADVYHSQAEREMIERNTPEELYPAVQRSSRRTAEALWNFLDGVYEAYVAKSVSMC
jgi:pyrroloquinoline-quinone synthase